MGLFGFIYFGTLCFLDLDVCFLHQVRDIFSHYFFEYVFCLLLLGPHNANVNMLDVVPEVSGTHLISQNSFFFLLFWLFPLPCLPHCWSILLYHLICYWILLLYSFQLFCFSVCLVLYVFYLCLSSVFIHTFPEFGDHSYKHYFEPFIWLIAYLCFV